jgi:hypothetical protein
MASSTAHIIVEVHCVRPSWAELHWDEKYRDSRYRLYVDSDLITERTWIWNNSTFLQENLWVNVDRNLTHTLKLEAVTHLPEQAQFSLQSMTLAKGSLTTLSTTPTEITFKVA